MKIAERLGGLPLAIIQVAALVDRWEMTLPESLAFYEKQPSIAAIAQNHPGSLNDHYKHSLFTVWALEDLNPPTMTILRIMSFLNPDRIRESLFTKHLPRDLPENFPSDNEIYIKARTEMIKVSLVRRNKEANELMLHRLVQDVVQAHMTRHQVLIATFELAVRLVLSAWPTGFLQFDHDMATWDRSEELLQHILKLQRAYRESWATAVSVKRQLAQLLLFAGWWVFNRRWQLRFFIFNN